MIKLLYWFLCWVMLGRAPRVDDRKGCTKCYNGYLPSLFSTIKIDNLSNKLCINGFCYLCCVHGYCMCIKKHVKLTNSEVEV